MANVSRILRAPAVIRQLSSFWQGYKTWRFFGGWNALKLAELPPSVPNPLRDFFDARTTGPGIWKWNHYFDIYHQHFQKFRGRKMRVLEIGVYSGGSLDMWADYFGEGCQIIGVDIEPRCLAYERPGVKIVVGDQSSRDFWARFRAENEPVDIVIDDGSHVPEMQIITLEELLPHVRPGGVYVCEDIHGTLSPFSSYAAGLAQSLNACERGQDNLTDGERRIVFQSIPLQSVIQGVFFYPFMVVIEKNPKERPELVAAKHGTEWQPFLK